MRIRVRRSLLFGRVHAVLVKPPEVADREVVVEGQHGRARFALDVEEPQDQPPTRSGFRRYVAARSGNGEAVAVDGGGQPVGRGGHRPYHVGVGAGGRDLGDADDAAQRLQGGAAEPHQRVADGLAFVATLEGVDEETHRHDGSRDDHQYGRHDEIKR